ncbi:GlxA family transcriptional regulator, partial [Rhizobium ruizarguesonis]
VFVVVPPRVLLLDVAGPIEVLRKANLAQRTVRFSVTYIGPSLTVGSSIGLAVTGVAAFPDRLPDTALVIIAGSADAPRKNSRPGNEQERADQ